MDYLDNEMLPGSGTALPVPEDAEVAPLEKAGDSDSFAVLAAELAVEGSPIADADLLWVSAICPSIQSTGERAA